MSKKKTYKFYYESSSGKTRLFRTKSESLVQAIIKSGISLTKIFKLA
jgi:hypothetical protein